MADSISCSITAYFNDKALLVNGRASYIPIWGLLRLIGLL